MKNDRDCAIEGSLAREDLALNLAACQPRGSKQPAELATDVVFSRPVRRRDEGGQLGLFERQFDLDRPRKENVMELIVLEHPHVAAGPYNLGHPPQCVDWIRKAIQALGAPDQVETAGRQRQALDVRLQELDVSVRSRLWTSFGVPDPGSPARCQVPEPCPSAPRVERAIARTIHRRRRNPVRDRQGELASLR